MHVLTLSNRLDGQWSCSGIEDHDDEDMSADVHDTRPVDRGSGCFSLILSYSCVGGILLLPFSTLAGGISHVPRQKLWRWLPFIALSALHLMWCVLVAGWVDRP